MRAWAAFLAAAWIAAVAPGDASRQAHPPVPATDRYARSFAVYRPPDVVLLDQEGAELALATALDHDGPLLLQLIFTTCPGVCPVLAATFQAVQGQLGDDLAKVRMVSISIDPEHDTPERLRDYARRFAAGPQWLFLTGRRDDVVAVQKSFDAYRGNKMDHEPLTFLRGTPGEEWLRLEGFVSAAELAGEVRAFLASADAALGERIYRAGVLPSGEPLAATLAGGAEVSGAAFSCASCHRRSGFGSTEGAAFVPPITSPALFGGQEPTRAELFRQLYQELRQPPFATRARDPRVRPAYDDDSLAVALREGRDPAGRVLDPWMPRYRLGDRDVAHLAAYLRTLDAAPDPGVDAARIHLATVVTEGVDPAARQAMLAVARAYVQRKNTDTEGFFAHPGHSPLHRDDFAGAYREWVLHEWRLAGPPEGWRAQLERAYRDQPVFAVVGGLGKGTWRPIHDFCEARRLPCLFPQTDLPPAEPGAYSLYLSRGLAGEARALGRYLRDTREDGAEVRLVQVYRDGAEGRAAARALATALAGDDAFVLAERVVADGGGLAAAVGRGAEPDVWVLWLGRSDWDALAPRAPGGRLVLSSSLLGEPPPMAEELRARLLLTYPFALPGHEGPRIFRVRAWLRSRGIERTAERVELNTFFAFSVAEHALDHLVESFSRDYFIEEVEHETENALSPGVFPHLSLGPGQRFASKGSYVVALSATGELTPVAPWIVP